MEDDYELEKKIGKVVGLVILGIVVFILFLSSFYTVSAGERVLVLTFSKPSETVIGEGLHFKVPLVQSIVKMNIKTLKYESTASAASKDLQTVNAKLAINYHLQQNLLYRIYSEIGLGYENTIIQPLEQEVIKAITAKFTAEELITKREIVREEMKTTLRDRLALKGINVEELSIVNFDFSKSFNDAIESKVTAEQNALAAKNKLQQVKFEAEQKIETARAEAESIRLQAEQLQNNKDIIQLRAIEKWNGVLPIYTGGVIPFINIETKGEK